jgi:hypothetical protein
MKTIILLTLFTSLLLYTSCKDRGKFTYTYELTHCSTDKKVYVKFECPDGCTLSINTYKEAVPKVSSFCGVFEKSYVWYNYCSYSLVSKELIF